MKKLPNCDRSIINYDIYQDFRYSALSNKEGPSVLRPFVIFSLNLFELSLISSNEKGSSLLKYLAGPLILPTSL